MFKLLKTGPASRCPQPCCSTAPALATKCAVTDLRRAEAGTSRDCSAWAATTGLLLQDHVRVVADGVLVGRVPIVQEVFTVPPGRVLGHFTFSLHWPQVLCVLLEHGRHCLVQGDKVDGVRRSVDDVSQDFALVVEVGLVVRSRFEEIGGPSHSEQLAICRDEQVVDPEIATLTCGVHHAGSIFIPLDLTTTHRHQFL